MRKIIALSLCIMLLTSCQFVSDVVDNAHDVIKSATSISNVVSAFDFHTNTSTNSQEDVDSTSSGGMFTKAFFLKKITHQGR